MQIGRAACVARGTNENENKYYACGIIQSPPLVPALPRTRCVALFNSRRVAPTVYPGGREQAGPGRGFAVSIATWRVYRRPGQPGGSFTGRRNAPAFTSASRPALSGKTVNVGLPTLVHFTKTLVLPPRSAADVTATCVCAPIKLSTCCVFKL